MSKKCIYCGAELADEAAFCPHCAKSQIPKTKMKAPVTGWQKKLMIIVAAAFGVLLAVLLSRLPSFLSEKGIIHLPQTYAGGASLQYADADDEYELVIAFDQGLRRDGSGWMQAQDTKKITMIDGSSGSLPAQILFIVLAVAWNPRMHLWKR